MHRNWEIWVPGSGVVFFSLSQLHSGATSICPLAVVLKLLMRAIPNVMAAGGTGHVYFDTGTDNQIRPDCGVVVRQLRRSTIHGVRKCILFLTTSNFCLLHLLAGCAICINKFSPASKYFYKLHQEMLYSRLVEKIPPDACLRDITVWRCK